MAVPSEKFTSLDEEADKDKQTDIVNGVEHKFEHIKPHKAIGHVELGDNVVRIVHISDTHMKHDECRIPDGDILVHSGDFVNCSESHVLEEDAKLIDDFFAGMPHKHKLFVAGNHELSFRRRRPEDISALLTHAIYLHDTQVTLEGITFYGSPWNTSIDMAFYKENLEPTWQKVPSDTDILVTHNPPFGIKDFGYNKFWYSQRQEWVCDFCTERSLSAETVYHGRWAHQGCPYLRKEIFNRIRPKAHLFGHVHNHNGVYEEDGIVFSNASLDCIDRPIILDFHVDSKRKLTQDATNEHCCKFYP